MDFPEAKPEERAVCVKESGGKWGVGWKKGGRKAEQDTESMN